MTAHPEVPFEQAKNAEYLDLLKLKFEKPIIYGTSRSQLWVNPQEVVLKGKAAFEPLAGRIGLDGSDEVLGTDFYVGPWRIDQDGIRAYNWDAPLVKKLFYAADADIDGAESLLVRRTFEREREEVVGLHDEVVRESAESPFSPAKLEVPVAPPTAGGRQRVASGPVTPVEPEPTPEPESEQGPGLGPGPEAEPSTQAAPEPVSAPKPPAPSRPAFEGMRAVEAVLSRLEAPRESRLASVLATLQPDQYGLVSLPAKESVIIQGHPGTGKTVIAAYRAVYLVREERKRERAQRVLLIGPTPEYVKHVDGLVSPLDREERVHLVYLEQLLATVVGAKGTRWSGSIDGRFDDVDVEAGGLAYGAHRKLVAAGRIKSGQGSHRGNVQAIYQLIEVNGGDLGPLSSDERRQAWMRKLPPFERALGQRRYLPFIAQCALPLKGVAATSKFDHIIVDEAQDMTPIEWNVIDQFMAAGGNWTLVGDMNQRRSHVSYPRWGLIADHLGIGDGDGEVEPVEIRRGYRSTAQILKFADRLLPAAQRGVDALQQHGAEVGRFRATTPAKLAPLAVAIAEDLIAKYPTGTVALIASDISVVVRELGVSGWRRGRDRSMWSKGGAQLGVFVPEGARGLEFDAVVVVEPGAFSSEFADAFAGRSDRNGPLYTSLTRANRELAIVWHKELPDALRRAGRQ